MVGDSVAGVLAGFVHGRRVRSVGHPERAAPVSAQEVLDPFHGHVVPENGPKEGQFTSRAWVEGSSLPPRNGCRLDYESSPGS